MDELREATAGAVGGLLSTTILYPLDTCKTKFQAEAQACGKHRKYRNLLDVLREAVEKKSIFSLYQGLGTKNVQSVLAGFVYFYSYASIKRFALAHSGAKRMNMATNLLVAAGAGACAALVTQPLDTISARMQTASLGQQPRSLLSTLRENGGVWTMFDGLGISLLLTCNPAIQYTVFEQLKDRLLQQKMETRAARGPAAAAALHEKGGMALSAFSAFLLGALSKTVATVLTYPAIRCKVLLQRAQTEEEKRQHQAGDKSAGPPKSVLQALRLIWSSEGIAGFYKGLHAQILKTVLAAALMLMVKEKVAEGTQTAFFLLGQLLFQSGREKRAAAIDGAPSASAEVLVGAASGAIVASLKQKSGGEEGLPQFARGVKEKRAATESSVQLSNAVASSLPPPAPAPAPIRTSPPRMKNFTSGGSQGWAGNSQDSHQLLHSGLLPADTSAEL